MRWQKKSLEYPRNDTRLVPLQHLLENITWGTKWKRAIEKTNEWATWWRANAKIDKKKSCIIQINYKHFQRGYEGLYIGQCLHMQWTFSKNVQIWRSQFPKHFFTSLLNNLSIKDLVTFGNLLSTKFMKPWWWLYATLSKQAWVP